MVDANENMLDLSKHVFTFCKQLSKRKLEKIFHKIKKTVAIIFLKE